MSLKFSHEGHRYTLDGKRPTSVTTILGGAIPKPALPYWAANQAAQYAIDNPGAPYDTIRKAPWDVRDKAAERGTAVHALAEALHNGEDITFDDELAGYIDGYLDFLDRFGVEPVLSECNVGIRNIYPGKNVAGRFDLLARIPKLHGDKVVMIDLKTAKGVYGETKLQTAAYSKADFYTTDADGETELELPHIEATYVAHVTPMDREGENARYGDAPLGTNLYLLAPDPEAIDRHYAMFRAAAYTYYTTRERDLIPAPMAAPLSAAA
ncbi:MULTISPECIES: hypothetical protein [Paenarthrobacter]|uniref:Exonuclease n=1 Tax=Paenarthrobacter ureafaciens TaxID=37931 RepID=A0AAX3EG14_PAEUR|nr:MULTISPECIES: hypothetical protein [Paenarthrobacter]MDO5865993.1 hypothetical protein [Paenarthrobacter sp. SD-2]MDO5877088.1 hypothetical protein [Paenarthrobacter sp. SD-1]UYV92290.1 hypothetical protein NL395_17475 [Paenarthrobacter ureafaciens]UYV96825.1 hypothetical protein NL394_17505 [Paenarthrobacter ureafaciens]